VKKSAYRCFEKKGERMPSSLFFPIKEGGVRPTIDTVHQKIHDGLHFTSSTPVTLAAASAVNVLITAPADGIYHFTASVETDAAATITFSKAPNATASGASVITAYNNNENSANGNTLAHTYLGTYTSSGTVLLTSYVGAATGNPGQPFVVGGTASGRNEIEFSPSSVHLIRVLAGAATCRTVINTYFYREA
jgi:hypothetical protein